MKTNKNININTPSAEEIKNVFEDYKAWIQEQKQKTEEEKKQEEARLNKIKEELKKAPERTAKYRGLKDLTEKEKEEIINKINENVKKYGNYRVYFKEYSTDSNFQRLTDRTAKETAKKMRDINQTKLEEMNTVDGWNISLSISADIKDQKEEMEKLIKYTEGRIESGEISVNNQHKQTEEDRLLAKILSDTLEIKPIAVSAVLGSCFDPRTNGPADLKILGATQIEDILIELWHEADKIAGHRVQRIPSGIFYIKAEKIFTENIFGEDRDIRIVSKEGEKILNFLGFNIKEGEEVDINEWSFWSCLEWIAFVNNTAEEEEIELIDYSECQPIDNTNGHQFEAIFADYGEAFFYDYRTVGVEAVNIESIEDHFIAHFPETGEVIELETEISLTNIARELVHYGQIYQEEINHIDIAVDFGLVDDLPAVVFLNLGTLDPILAIPYSQAVIYTCESYIYLTDPVYKTEHIRTVYDLLDVIDNPENYTEEEIKTIEDILGDTIREITEENLSLGDILKKRTENIKEKEREAEEEAERLKELEAQGFNVFDYIFQN